MSAPNNLRSSSSDSDDFEVIPESHPNDEQSAVMVDDVEKMCSGLESRIDELSVQVEESGVSMKKDEEIIKRQEKTIYSPSDQIAKWIAENELMMQAQVRLEGAISRRNGQNAEKEKEKSFLRSRGKVKKQKDVARRRSL